MAVAIKHIDVQHEFIDRHHRRKHQAVQYHMANVCVIDPRGERDAFIINQRRIKIENTSMRRARGGLR